MFRSIDLHTLVIIALALGIPYIINYYKKWLLLNTTVLVVSEFDTTIWWKRNDVFIHIDTFLSEKYAHLINSYITDSFITTETIPNTHIQRGYSINKPNNISITIYVADKKIKFTKYRVKPTKDSVLGHETSYEYEIQSASMENIKYFLTEAQEYYINYRIKKEINMYKIYHYHKDSKSWKDYSINVNKSHNNVFLDPLIKNEIINTIKQFNTAKFVGVNDRLGLPNKYAYLFYGEPGCGKTSTVLFISKISNMPIYSLPALDSIKAEELIILLSQLPENIIILADDFDCCKCLHVRNSAEPEVKVEVQVQVPGPGQTVLEDKNKTKDESYDKLRIMLEFLDAYSSIKNSIIILTANHPENLDPALLRFGRIDFKYKFCQTKKEHITDIMPEIVLSSDKSLAENLHLHRLQQLKCIPEKSD